MPSVNPAKRLGLGVCISAALLLAVWAALMAPGARAAVSPEQDPFYRYQGATPLFAIAPGTVLKTRSLPYHVLGIPLPITAVQLLVPIDRGAGSADCQRDLGAPAATALRAAERDLLPVLL